MMPSFWNLIEVNYLAKQKIVSGDHGEKQGTALTTEFSK